MVDPCLFMIIRNLSLHPSPKWLIFVFRLLSFLRTKTMFFYFEGFPFKFPPTYVIPPPVAFSMGSGYTFLLVFLSQEPSLQPAAHSPAGNQKSWETVPHPLQPAAALWTRARDPGTPAASAAGPSSPSHLSPLRQQQTASQLQVQALAQQQQSPTKAVPALGKSPPHHSDSSRWVTVVCTSSWGEGGAPGNHSVSS